MDNYTPHNQAGAATLVILENGIARVCALQGRSRWLMGRQAPGSTPDIPLSSNLASRNHGTFSLENGSWYYVENPQNTNGTYYNDSKVPRSVSGKSYRVHLHNGDVLRIQVSSANAKTVVILFSTVSFSGNWGSVPLTGKSITIGRSSSCDISIPLPYVSSSHARIDCIGGQYRVSDCGSKSGTFLNGKPVQSAAVLKSGDCISLCGKPVFFLGSCLLTEQTGKLNKHIGGPSKPYGSGTVILQANIQTKKVKNNSGSGVKELIRDIRLEIREGTLVALLGTAGAGKSTVMNCLNGMDLEGVSGSVIYRNVNLMHNFEQMKHMIGSVPQKKTFHPHFTPEQEFTFAAQKRLPANTGSQEIQRRVNQTLEMLSMNGVRSVPNSKLSGGEQTRVNVGIELVADRDFLCLDEPDQGLSPNYKHELFQILQNLAHKNGKSILSIIHDVSEIDMFDQVIMLAKVDGVGRLAFSGSPADARNYFGTDIQYAYSLLEQNPRKYVR